MTITVLDMDTAVLDGDVIPQQLAALGEVRCVGGTDHARTAERIGDADAVICNKSKITRAVMERCPRLRYVGLMGTGFDQVDLAAASEHGITVCNVPAYSANAVAQHTFALILNYFGRISDYAADCAAGDWTRKQYFNRFGYPTHELAGKTIGLIGCGSIGRKTAEIARAFDMQVMAFTRHPERLSDVPYIRCVGSEELLSSADVVSLHCPLNEQTREFINRETLALMKPTALLVNTARGGIVKEADLAQALNDGVIAAAAIDVLTEEPMSSYTPLRHAANITITPHIAWAPVETRTRLFDVVCENIKSWIEGTPQNVVNPQG